jgi:cobalt/nickel transport system ATP-binding protein
MPPSATPALQFIDLDFSYPDTSDVLRRLNLSIHTGERVGLIGPNGAGKTTLFLVACGLLSPTVGEVRLLGRTVTKGRFNPELALVFQRSDDQLFCPSVREDVAFGPENIGLNPIEVEQRVMEALTAVGAQHLASRPVHHLSEGEKRMVAIAGVLALRPQVIIYDEPSAGLDIRSRRRLIPLLHQSAPTTLIASHDLELILETCTRVLLMDGGQIVADGVPAEIMSDEVLMATHGQEKPHSLVPHQVAHRHS